jgi:regulator of sigma E protease
MTIEGIQFSFIAVLGLLVILVPLVLFHELGHFIAARLVGIRVLEFGLGFPPRAKVLGHDHETEYTLNYLPIGGFVRLEGEEADSDDPRAFGNAPLLKQVIVLVAGVTMNLITAVVLLFIVAWAFNPITAPTITLSNDPKDINTPARVAGLQDGETLISIDGQPFTTASVLAFSSADPTNPWRQQLLSHQGQKVELVVADTTGKQRTVAVELRVPDKTHQGALGVALGSVVNSPGNPAQAAGLAVTGTFRAMSLIAETLGNIVTGFASSPTTAPGGVQGPLGIASDVGHVATQPNALMLLLLFMAVISANLALVNVLPLPALDGGKVLIMVLKRIFGVHGVGVVEQWSYVAGFAFSLAFIGWITYFDIVRGGAP